MPPPRKTASSKTALKTKNQISPSSSFSPKPCFNETVVIYDSDDDFVTPRPSPSIRVKLPERSYRQQNETAVDPAICCLNSNDAVAASGRDFNNTTTPVKRTDKKFNFKLKSCNQTQLSETEKDNRKSITDRSFEDTVRVSTSIFSPPTPTADSWKDLMVRMQLNQKTKSLQTSKKSNQSTSFKLRRNKAVVKKVVSTSTLTQQGFQKNFIYKNSAREGSPPKKLKLDPIEIITMDEVEVDTMDGKRLISQSDPSTSSAFDTISIFSSSTSSNQVLTTINKKIPSIFLKPAERVAIAQAQKQERSLVQIDLSDALIELSTEPETYESAIETNSAYFDDNIVKLNETFTEDPYKKTKVCPFYKKLPGTRFSVDAFNYGLIPGIEVYFLSHFHSDHYIGLSKKFCKTLVCSPPTANLVRMKFNVDENCIRRLQINKPYIIDEVEVTLINANHCPGSVMFIFRLPNGTTFFHTGDFRFTVDMLGNPNLRDLRVDCLYLDTTYCDPQYNFPTQTAAIAELITVVRRKLELQPKTLIVCGTYVIGKERVYLSLAEAIGAKVYMNNEKKGIINALENPKYLTYLAGREDLASIHVHQMFGINPKFLSEYLNSRTNLYTHIIGIKPTGWQFSSSGDGSSIKSFYNNTITIIGVPYSEHSSFSELEHFVRAIKPSKVQPTVNVGSVVKRESMMIHINKWLLN